jgi:hypothetical protein
MTKFIFNKKNLKLNEGNNNTDSVATVKPSSNSITSVASDLTASKQDNPTVNTFEVDPKNYNGNTSDDPIPMEINAENPADASKQIQNLTKRQDFKQIKNPKIRVTFNENCVTFSKKELNEMLKK